MHRTLRASLTLVALLLCAPSAAGAQADGASRELGSPTVSPQVAEPVAPPPEPDPSLQERRQRVGFFAAGVPLGVGGLVAGPVGVWLLADPPCDSDFDLFCVAEPMGYMWTIIGAAMSVVSAVVLLVGGFEWAGVEAHNRRVRERGGLFVDARGAGLRF